MTYHQTRSRYESSPRARNKTAGAARRAYKTSGLYAGSVPLSARSGPVLYRTPQTPFGGGATGETSSFSWKAIQWALASFIVMMPLMMRSAATILAGVMVSPNTVIPTTNAPTAPMPVQIV